MAIAGCAGCGHGDGESEEEVEVFEWEKGGGCVSLRCFFSLERVKYYMLVSVESQSLYVRIV